MLITYVTMNSLQYVVSQGPAIDIIRSHTSSVGLLTHVSELVCTLQETRTRRRKDKENTTGGFLVRFAMADATCSRVAVETEGDDMVGHVVSFGVKGTDSGAESVGKTARQNETNLCVVK